MGDEGVVLEGPQPPYEPAKGGLGFEIFRSLQINKDKIAEYYLENDESSTYGDLLVRSRRLALSLLLKNLKKEDVVCVCSHNQKNCVVPFFASKFIDVNYASIEPTMTEEDLIYLFRYAEPKVLFIADNVEDKIERCLKSAKIGSEIVVFGKSERNSSIDELLKPNPEEINFKPVFIEDIYRTAMIFFSSGTTGKPKGICCNHYSLLSQNINLAHLLCNRGLINLSNYSYNLGGSTDENITWNMMIYSPMYWISGIQSILLASSLGCIRTIGASFDSEMAWSAMAKYKVNSAFFPPGQVVDLYLKRNKGLSYNGLEVFITGGGPIKSMHLQYINEMFPNAIAVQMLGMTEATGPVSAFCVNNPKHVELQKKYPSSCGLISNGNSCRIVDVDSETTCKLNQQGELRLKSKYLMNGYYKMDTTSVFDSEGWFKTGDLAYINEDNCLNIVDRLKDILLYTIYNIRPSVIDDILARHPSVHECFVIGIPHIEDNEHPLGVVLLKKEYKGAVNAEELIRFVNERVPADRYKIRAGIKFVNEMIKTPTGKIKKIAMKNLIIEGKL